MKLQSDKAMSTEDKILDAALDVVQEHTISGTRIHLVAEYAGLFQSNIHYYFKSKRDLLLAVLQRLQRRCLDIRAELREQADAGLDAQLDIFFKQKKQFILHETKYDYAEIDFWTQARLDEEIRERFAVSFRKWREEIGRVIARYAPQVSPSQRSFLSALMVSMMEGATLQYLVDEDVFALDDYFARCKQLILEQLRQEN
ncbi:TetR/AcrR family transcriptional regulator [Butyricicoccus sp.]|uniref:TetR/AcrR family transcriptional regulator n=1 Tax=Butyricicoccus sp. TaxID=2049021 RepID=UPI003F177CA3